MKKIIIPGSKSISNRVLYLAALSPNNTVLYGLLESDDTQYMRQALENFGVKFEELSDHSIKVIPPEKFTEKFTENYIGNAGTAARFLATFALISPAEYSLTGVERMSERPFEDLFLALRDLNVAVNDETAPTHLPATFKNLNTSENTTETPHVKISGKISSQFLSGLLLTASRMPYGLRVQVTDRLPSLPYIKMTLEILGIFGVEYEVDQDYLNFYIKSGIKNPDKFYIPGDSSAASIPIAYSLLSGEDLCIENFGENPMQGDAAFTKIAEKFGAKIEKNKDQLTIVPKKSEGKYIWNNPEVLDFEAMPDVSMTGMILAAVGKGTTKFVGLESLRVKECDRIIAMAEGLEKLEIEIKIESDDMWITGNSQNFPENFPPQLGLIIDSVDDHRIAFCFGLLQKIYQLPFLIKDNHCVTKTWPDFWLDLAQWQNRLRPVCAIIVKNKAENTYMIVKKPRINNAWQFPQGGQDQGETDKQTALRELGEECGLDLVVKIKGERPTGSHRYMFPDNFMRHAIDNGWTEFDGAHVKFFNAEYISGTVRVDGEELIGHSWLPKEHLTIFFAEEYAKGVMQFVE